MLHFIRSGFFDSLQLIHDIDKKIYQKKVVHRSSIPELTKKSYEIKKSSYPSFIIFSRQLCSYRIFEHMIRTCNILNIFV
jgi:hypothetical protein